MSHIMGGLCFIFAALILAPPNASSGELPLPTSGQIPIDLSNVTILNESGNTVYQTPDGTVFNCGSSNGIDPPCLSNGVITPPGFLGPVPTNPSQQQYQGVVGFDFEPSTYYGRITAFSLTATLDPISSPSAGGSVVYYTLANANGSVGSTQIINFSDSMNSIQAVAPPGMYIANLTVGGGDLPVDPPVTMTVSNIVLTVSPLVSLSISDAHFWQVIEDPVVSSNGGLDGVAGKSASFSVELTGSNLQNSNNSDQISISVTDGNGNQISSTGLIGITEISNQMVTNGSGAYEVTADKFTAFKPISSGTAATYIFSINNQNAYDIQSPQTLSIPVNIHQITPPAIGLVAVTQSPEVASGCTVSTPGCVGTVTTNDEDILMTAATGPMSEMYPVPDNSNFFNPNLGSIVGYDPNENVDSGILSIIFAPDPMSVDLAQLSELKVQNSLNRVVGVVSKNYFSNRNIKAAGVFVSDYPGVALASDIDPIIVLHELAHSFGQGLEGYCYPTNGTDITPSGCAGVASTAHPYDKTPVNGYDATIGSYFLFPQPAPNSFSAPFANAISIMGPVSNSWPIKKRWVDNDTYLKIFSTFSQPISDPDVIAISGILSTSGQFLFRSSFNLPNGTLTPNVESGDLTVSSLDENDNLINSVSIQTNFTAIGLPEDTTTGPTAFQLSSIPVLVELPASPSAETIQISAKNGKIVSKASINGQILLGIVNDIPNNAFKSLKPRKDRDHDHDKDDYQNASASEIIEDKKCLLSLVDEIQNLLSSKRPQKAIPRIMWLIEEIRRMTFDDYSVSSKAQLTQEQVISDIENILYKVEHTKSTRDSKEKE